MHCLHDVMIQIYLKCFLSKQLVQGLEVLDISIEAMSAFTTQSDQNSHQVTHGLSAVISVPKITF